MKIKKYEEIKYEPNRMIDEYKKDIRNLTIIVFIVAILGIIACLRGLKIATEYEVLKRENEELVKANEMKDSLISDYQENLKDLFIENQELKFGGNK